MFARVWTESANVMASPGVVIWKLAGSGWRLSPWWDPNWRRSTIKLHEYHFKTTYCKRELKSNQELCLARRKSWSTLTRPQTTASGTTVWDLQEWWEGHVGMTKCPRPSADLCVTLVKWGIKQLNFSNKLNVSVSLFGAVASNARSVLRSFRWQHAQEGNLLRMMQSLKGRFDQSDCYDIQGLLSNDVFPPKCTASVT